MRKTSGCLCVSNCNHCRSSTEEDRHTSADTAPAVSGNTFQQNQEQFALCDTKTALKRSFDSTDDGLEKQKQMSIKPKQCIRAERFEVFVSDTKTTSKSFKNNGRWMSPTFVEEAIKRNPAVSRSEQVEKAADGIRREGRDRDKTSASDELADLLLEVKDKSWIEIAERVINVYTRESFLYNALNTALREEDLSKVDTLGPFCDLLWNCLSCKYLKWKYRYTGVVYRGAKLEPEAIEDYRNSIGKSAKEWLGFSSATKDRGVAEIFGVNTLFIIHLPSPHLDISRISHIRDEEEVLLGASTGFQIKAVSFDKESGRNIIELKVLW